MTEEFGTFLSLFLIAATAALIPLLLRRIKKINIPVSVGEIIAGIIIGKSGFDIIQINAQIEFLYQVGLAFLMFLAGLEIDFGLLNNRREVRGVNSIQIGAANFSISFCLAVGVAVILYHFKIITDLWIFALVFCSTAVGIVVPTLKEGGMLKSEFGQTVLMSAVISDFATMVVLSVYITLTSGTSYLQLFLILIFIPLFYLCKRLASVIMRSKYFSQLKDNTSQVSVKMSYAILLLFISSAYLLKTEMILGAFLAGLMISALNTRENNEIFHKFDAIGYGVFISVFFLIVGVKFDLWSLLRNVNALLFMLAVVLIIYCINLISGLVFRKSFGLKQSLSVSAIMSSRLSLVIAAGAVGYQHRLIDANSNDVIVLTAIITCIVSPILFNKLYSKGDSGKLSAGRHSAAEVNFQINNRNIM